MTQTARLPSGGVIDRTRPMSFTFDRQSLAGYAGDTVASALLANGVLLVGRSFKLHRPRGIFGAGYEDAGILVSRLRPDPSTNQLATTLPLVDGMRLASVNAWPSASLDLGAAMQAFSRLLPAGFYYKTFMAPGFDWFEPSIRRLAGLGRLPGGDAWLPSSESRFGHCDLLVAGAGPAGLVASLVAARAGLRVVLVDDGMVFGGRLVADAAVLDGRPAGLWVDAVLGELRSCPNVRVLGRSSVWGYHEHNLVTVLERDPPDARGLHLRNWKIRAAQVVVATGAIERPIAFANNDRPGTMLASAVRSYVNQFAVLPGRRAVVFANTDSAYATACDLARSGATVQVVNPRPGPMPDVQDAARALGVICHQGAQVRKAFGGRHVEAVEVVGVAGATLRLDCDLLASSGGWNAAIHLASQSRQVRVAWSDAVHGFVATPASANVLLAGAANGLFALSQCLEDGLRAGAAAVAAWGATAPPLILPQAQDDPYAVGPPLWAVAQGTRRDKVFVDFSGDVSTADLGLAIREGFDSIELIKRYTTAGMGVDQGKTGNLNVIGVVGAMTGVAPGTVGSTTFRPPFVPIEFGAIAGARSGARMFPWRHTPLTEWHLAHGAVMVDAGMRWQRPGYYAQAGESWRAAAERAALAVRHAVGVYDGTPLGKFMLKGPGVPALLDLLYVNDFANLQPGRGRYGLMLSDDGLILDDGVTFRIDDAHWLLHSSTGAAERVHQHIETVLHVLRPDLAVSLIPMTSAWANATLCGPKARDVLQALQPDFDVSGTALPFMAMREGRLGDVPVRVFRVSWTGELSFEINCAPRYAVAMWERIMAVGAQFGITPVGSETSHILRVDAGYFSTGHEVDGTSDVFDLGLGAMVSGKKADFLGKRSMYLRRSVEPVRAELVGFLPADPGLVLPDGAPITPGGAKLDQEGFVSASVHSVALQRCIALGLLHNGRARMGETVFARVYGKRMPMVVVAPVFYDADRKRVKS